MIDRDEWLLVMGIFGDIREELRVLNAYFRGDDEGEEEETEEDASTTTPTSRGARRRTSA